MATYIKKIFMSKVYTLFVSLCFALSIQSTFLNIEELQKSKYGVEISAEPVLVNNQNNDGSSMQITSKHGQQYQCILPIVHFETRESNTANVTTEEINNLLEPLNDTCLYQLNGWWTYRVCIGRSIHQYHDEGHQVKDNISLGHFIEATDWSKVTIKEETRGDKRYHSQFYSNGTVCDLTGEPRRTEVRFFCNAQGSDHVSRIDESSTCVYVITIYTNTLCNHSLFRPPTTPKKHSITCSPALMEDQFKKYTEAQKKISDEEAVSDEDEHTYNGLGEDIADTLAKTYRRKLKGDEIISWDDVFKTASNILDKSMERVKKLGHRKESSQDEDDGEENSEEENDNDNTIDEDEDDIDEESEENGGYRKTRKLKAKNNVIDDLEDDPYDEQEGDALDREDDLGWDGDTVDDIDESMDIEGSSGSSAFKKGALKNIFSDKNKHKKDENGDYYQELLERLKMQYRYFKKQLEIVTNDMKKRIKSLEDSIPNSSLNPVVKALIDNIKMSVTRLERKQRVAEDAMRRLTVLYDTVMEDPDYSKASEELASIRSTLVGLIEKVTSKSGSSEPNDDNHDDIDYNEEKHQPYKPSVRTEDILKSDKRKKSGGFDMETPKLDKIVSKLKKMMTRDSNEDMDSQQQEDDRISVRVAKIKEKSEELYDDKDLEKSFAEDEDDKELDEMNGNEEMRAATKKMESMVRKQLQEAGVNHGGKIKVKIVTSKEALQRVASGEDKFQILTSQETNQFRDLLTNLLGGTQELMKEKKRQEVMEDNYNLVWNQDGLASAAVNEEQLSVEHEDTDENR